jgi:hypothetical protein
VKPKDMPALRDTGRRYLDETRRARLASPGLERFTSARRASGWPVIAAVLVVAAVLGALAWLRRGGS